MTHSINVACCVCGVVATYDIEPNMTGMIWCCVNGHGQATDWVRHDEPTPADIYRAFANNLMVPPQEKIDLGPITRCPMPVPPPSTLFKLDVLGQPLPPPSSDVLAARDKFDALDQDFGDAITGLTEAIRKADYAVMAKAMESMWATSYLAWQAWQALQETERHDAERRRDGA